MKSPQPPTPQFTVALEPGTVTIAWPAQVADGFRVYAAEEGAGYLEMATAAKGATSATFAAPPKPFYVRVFADLAGVPSQTLSEGPFTPIAKPAAPEVDTPPTPAAMPTPAIPPGFKPAIKIVYAGVMAPAQVHLDLTGLYPAPAVIDDVPAVSTDFDDPAGQQNIVPGPFSAAHLYSTPGTYTITASIAGKAVATTIVTITPDTRQKVYVSAAGSDTGGDGSMAKPFASLARAIKIGSNARIMLRCGDTFLWSTQTAAPLNNVVVSSYGAGNAPVLKYNGPRAGSAFFLIPLPGSQHIVFQDIAFDSIFTTHAATVAADTAYANNNSIMASGITGLTAWGCDLLNIDYGLTMNGGIATLIVRGNAPQVNTSGARLPLHTDDTTSPNVTGLRANAVYGGGGSYLAVYGLNVANSTQEHCIRIDGTNFVSIIDCDLTNLNREPLDTSDIAKSTILFHCGSHLYAGGNIARKGTPGAGPLNGADLAKAPVGSAGHDQYLQELGHSCQWVVFENNTVEQAPVCIQPGASHVSLRGNTVASDNADAFLINGYDSNFHRLASDIVVDGNKVTNNGTAGRMLNVSAPNPTTTPLPAGQKLADGIRVRNNTYTAPNLVLNKGTGAAGIFVQEANLDSFAEIDGNVFSPNVENYVGAGIAINKANYRTTATTTVAVGAK